MSKETKSTTSEAWNPQFSHANEKTPVKGAKVEGTYAFVSADLIESRMVINPNALVTEDGQEVATSDTVSNLSPTDNGLATEPKSSDVPADTAAPKESGSESTSQAPSEPTPPVSPAAPTVERQSQSEKSGKLREWLSGKLAAVGLRLNHYATKREEGRTARGLAKAASWLTGMANKNTTSANTESPTETLSLDTQSMSPTDSKESIFNKANKRARNLGKSAVKWFKQPLETPKEDGNDESKGVKGFFNRTKKNIEKERKASTLFRKVGASTLIAAAAGGLLGANLLAGQNSYEAKKSNATYYEAGMAYAIEVHEGVDTTLLTMGGNYESTPRGEIVRQALEQGVNVQGVEWYANMGIGGGGTPEATKSLHDGANTLRENIKWLDAHNQKTGVMAYSWGTVATAQAYHDLKMSDPELYERVAPPVLYGSPFGKGGFNGPFGKVAMQMFGVNPEIMNSLPKGTTFVYSDRDVFATSGHGTPPLTDAFNAAMTSLGAHEQQNKDNAYIRVQDSDGNYHLITHFDAAAALGITGAGNAEINDAIDKLFPKNLDPDSKEMPRADVVGAILSGSKGLDMLVSNGNPDFKFFQHIQDRVPDEWKKLLDTGVNGINESVTAIMEAYNNPNPETLLRALTSVVSTAGSSMHDLKEALERDMPADIKNGGIDVASRLLSENLHLDYNTVHRELTTFVNQIEQGAKAQAAKIRAAVQADIQARQAERANGNAPRVVLDYPQSPVTYPRPTNPLVPQQSQNNANTPSANTSNLTIPKARVEAPAQAPQSSSATVEQKPATQVQQPARQSAPRAASPVERVAPPAPAPAEPAAPAESVATEPTPPPAPTEVIPAAPPAPAEAQRPSLQDVLKGIFDKHTPSAANSIPSAPAPGQSVVLPLPGISDIPQASNPAGASAEPPAA